MSDPVTVIDYGAGNLASITAGLERLGSAPQVSDRPDAIAGSPRLVLPGVGAAAPAMAELHRRGLVDAIGEAVDRGAALLGICLGMQLLFERSREGDAECLGLMRGETVSIDWSDRLPHMGWNDVDAVTDHPLTTALPSVCYFAHSYVVDPRRALGGGGRDRPGRPPVRLRGRRRTGRGRPVSPREERRRRPGDSRALARMEPGCCVDA